MSSTISKSNIETFRSSRIVVRASEYDRVRPGLSVHIHTIGITEPALTEIRVSRGVGRAEESSGRLYDISRQNDDDQPGGIPMQSGTDRICLYSYESVRALESRRRHHEVRPFVRSRPCRNAVWGVVFALAATLGAEDHSLARDPLGIP